MNRTTWGKLGLICGALIFFVSPLGAQQTGPVSTPQPNCSLQFTFAAAGNSQVLDNRQVGCLNFTVTASVPTTVSALSLLVQIARDNGSTGCSTCTWTTFAAATGANPIITFANGGGNATFTTTVGTAYPDFLRVQLTSVTPSSLGSNHIFGKLYSSITSSAGGGGGGGSGCVGSQATPCIVAGPDASGAVPTQSPVQVAGSDGTDIRTIRTDATGDPQVAVIGNAAVLSNQQAVTAAAVALATHAVKNVCVKSLIGNSINVYVGPTGVTDATGMELAPGDSVCLPVSNTNLLFVIASTTGASVSWIGTN